VYLGGGRRRKVQSMSSIIPRHHTPLFQDSSFPGFLFEVRRYTSLESRICQASALSIQAFLEARPLAVYNAVRDLPSRSRNILPHLLHPTRSQLHSPRADLPVLSHNFTHTLICLLDHRAQCLAERWNLQALRCTSLPLRHT
jgi:hypothetical protein